MSSSGLAKGRDVWVQRERSGDRADEGFDPHAEPCQTLTEKARSWTVHRPATNVNGDARISAPGHHDENESGSQQKNAVRVTVREAAILQSFPPDFPWQGSRTARFRQIGNAVPPRLARAILSALLASRGTVGAVDPQHTSSDGDQGNPRGSLRGLGT